MTGAARGQPLTVREVLAAIKRLPTSLPLMEAYEKSDRAERARRTVRYEHQKEHLIGWLSEAGGVGFYGRQKPIKDAKAFYNSFKCVAALIWLAEALGVPEPDIRAGIDAVTAGSRNPASECGAFRKHVPWAAIESRARRALQSRPGLLARIKDGFGTRFVAAK